MITNHELHHRSKLDSLRPFIIHSWNSESNLISNWHSNIEIICALDGELFLQYDDEILKLSQGELSIINPNVLHRVKIDCDKKYHCIIIDNLFCLQNGIDTEVMLFDKQFTSPTVYKLCQEVAERDAEYLKNPSDINVARLRSSILLLLIEVYENHRIPTVSAEKVRSKTSEQYVKNVISYLADHYQERITLDTLSNLCGVTKCHLSREFRKYTGQTVMTYLNFLRCKNAQKIIRDGSSITEAATSVGFDDLSYFSKTYKSLMGISPTKDKKD